MERVIEYIQGAVGNYAGLIGVLTGPQVLFAGVGLVFLLLYGISLGRTRALVSLLGIYIAFVFDATFVYLEWVHNFIRISPDFYITRIALFLAFYLLIFFVLNRSLVKSRLTLREVSFISVFIISVIQLGLLVSIISSMLPEDILDNFPSFFTRFFGSGTALFFWALAPLVMLLFLKNESRRRSGIGE